MRIGADNAFAAWLNGDPVAESKEGTPNRDATKTPVTLARGWNRLLLKIANRQSGRLGFYCRLCDAKGGAIPGLVYSTEAGGPLRVTTASMPEADGANLPAAFREWALRRRLRGDRPAKGQTSLSLFPLDGFRPPVVRVLPDGGRRQSGLPVADRRGEHCRKD